MTQSVLNVCSPSLALHQFVVWVVDWPACSVTEILGELTWLPLKKLTRWLKVTGPESLFRMI